MIAHREMLRTSAMANGSEIAPDFTGIGKLVMSNRLVVPLNQRPYAWEEGHVAEFLSDIANALAKKESEYFLGTVVLAARGPNAPQVVDGQQRLATSIILIAAIRDHLFRSGDLNRVADIERDYIATRDLRTQERQPRLTLSTSDHDYFDKTVLARPDSPTRQAPPLLDSQRRIQRASLSCAKYVQRLVETFGSTATDRLLDLVVYLTDCVKVIALKVADQKSAFRVFETLNDRGLDLTIGDLLKNYLLELADNRIQEADRLWNAMIGTLEAVDEDEIQISFIRHYWSSVNGLTRGRELFDRIKQRTTSKQAALDLVSDLSGAAVKYAALANPTSPVWAPYGATAQGHISTLNLLRMTQMRPLLLAVLDQFETSEARRAIRLLVSIAVRVMIVGSRSGTLEEGYSNAAVRIRAGTIRSAKSLLDDLNGIVPADQQFEDAFSIATVSKDQLARYYLRALEQRKTGADHPEWVPNPNQEEVSLEHVLPENPGEGWDNIDSELAPSLYKRIGNLALLRVEDNEKIGNRAFAEKRPVLAHSEYVLTRMIGESNEWTQATITERQRALAKLAIETWPRKP